MGIDKNTGVKQQESAVISPIYWICYIVGAQADCEPCAQGYNDLPQPKAVSQAICPVCHIQHYKAVKEAETVGDHIGEMETVPNVVQLPDDETHVEKQQQKHSTDLIPHPNVSAEEKQQCKCIRKETTVQIGKSLLEAGLNAAVHIAGYLTHSIQKSLPGVLIGNIQPEALREGVDAGLGGLQGGQSRQLQKCGHANGDHRKNAH